MKNMNVLVFFLFLLLILFGCTGSDEPSVPSIPQTPEEKVTPPSPIPSAAQSLADSSLVGKWRNATALRYIGQGGGHYFTTTEILEIRSDSTWSIKDSSGTWEVADIAVQDWESWGITPYEPTRKIVMHESQGQTWEGPLEESNGQVDFFWIVYPLDEDGRRYQDKFIHSTWD